MDLDAFASAISSHTSIKKKFAIHDVLKILGDNAFNKENVIKDIGEDAAAVEIGGTIGLIATDMISSDLVKRAPFSAGYSAILVCIDDIYACGGTPLTAAIDVQAATEATLHELVKGAKKAAEQFDISITRGHTSLKDSGDVIACTVVGTHASDKDFISPGDAKPGDMLVLIWDADGKRSPNGPYWDTVTFKTKEDVLRRRELMVDLSGSRYYPRPRSNGKGKLLRASKDVSDAGLFGTTFLMANYSRVGCEFDVKMLLDAFGVKDLEELLWFTTAYLTTAFIVALDPKDIIAVQKKAIGAHMQAPVVGRVVPGSTIVLFHSGSRHVLLDWRKTPVFPEPATRPRDA
jgi:selenophosphate synthetase-related protein